MDIIRIVKDNLSKKHINKFGLISSVLRRSYVFICAICSYFKFQWNKITLKQLKSKCVLINSPWGCGKTYRVKNNLIPVFEEKGYHCVYVSLFGIKDIKALKLRLIDIYLNHKYIIFIPFMWLVILYLLYKNSNNQILNGIFYTFLVLFVLYIFKLCDLINIVKCLSNKYFGSGISLDKSEIGELFNPYSNIFIFDDLERLSDDCNIREIMGFIADLKYIYGFNILIIGDENRINKDKHLNEYNLYKEKLIDYEKNEIEITNEIFDELLENIENKKIKQFVKYLKPHIELENNNYQKTPTTKNLRLILRCIDDIKRLFNNNLINNENLYWIDDNFESGIDNLLNTDDKQIFILDNDIECIIDVTIERYIYSTMTEEELEKEQAFSKYRVRNLKSDNLKDLNEINDKYIRNNILKNKLQILNSYCLGISLPNEISEELYDKIKQNLINCNTQIKFFNEDFKNYVQSFVNLCAVASKDINEYQQHFMDLTKIILNKYYTDFYRCRHLVNLMLDFHDTKGISEVIHKEIEIYQENNVFKFFKQELKKIDNNYKNQRKYINDIINIFIEFITNFGILIYKNPNILLDIDLDSYKNSSFIKIELLRGLDVYWETIWRDKINSLAVKNVVEQLSKYYSTPRQKFAFENFIEKINN